MERMIQSLTPEDLRDENKFELLKEVSHQLLREFVVELITLEKTIIRIYSVYQVLMMVLFAILMVAASISMIRSKDKKEGLPEEKQTFNYPLIFLEGLIVGTLTGLVGAGGGFLIIPALVLLSKLPMKQAVGTSLLIIAAKSLIGFTGDLSLYTIDWKLILVVTAIAIAGIFIGNKLSTKVSSEKLKKGFGWFVLVMGIYILLKETVFAS